jgi:uncharacterized protein YbjT (DUF2867 family)
MRIAVAGGTGVVGRAVVAEVGARGHEAVVLSRSHGVDLTTGEGLDAALADVAAVVDVVNAAVWTREAAEQFFGAVTEHLTAGCARAGVGHLVVLGIVGADVVDLDYYHGKRREEELVRAGTVPWSILHATQFHDFAAQLLERSPGRTVDVPTMLARPVATADVAARLVDLAAGAPRGVVEPIAGPEEMTVADMARQVVARRGLDVEVREAPAPGRLGELLAGGALTPGGGCSVGTHTFAEYLDGLRG